MKKYYKRIFFGCSSFIFIAMRTTLIIILLSAFNTYAINNYAQSKQLSVTFDNVPLKKVLKDVEKQSEFYFMYNDTKVDVMQKVSVRLESGNINQLLDQLLYGTGIEYKILDRQIVLNPDKSKRNTINSQQDDEITVTGTVTDEETGEPLPGVSIIEVGTQHGTTTDINGEYTFIVPEDAELEFSFVGYKTQRVAVEGRTNIDIQLVKKMQKLDEVVVIGYGSSSKRLLTSSISSVSSEEIEEAVASGIQEAIQGRTSGVHINRNSGTPGAAISMNIRGKSSITAGTQPLYVVDGVPITTGNYSQISMEGQGISAIADLNPNNIKSISILKDASAAAIYGARAGNGVVLIETKTGSAEKTSVNVKTYYGMQEIYKKLDMLNATEWKNYVRSFDPGFLEGLDPDINTNWIDAVLRERKDAPVANTELSFRGGNEKTKFFISGRYFMQDGIVIGTSYNKLNSRINVDHQVSDKIKIGARVSATYTDNDRVRGDQSVNGVLPNAISKPPVYQVKDSLGNYLQQGFWDNPVAIGNEVVNNAGSFRNISNVFGEIDIVKGLTFKNQWGADIYNLHERRFEPSIVKSASEENGYAVDATTEVIKITQQSTLNYIKSFGNHNINLLAGYSFETINEKYNSIDAIDFPSDELQYITSAGRIENASSNAYNEGLQSFFGRLKYNFDNKYLFSSSIRRDGSSLFGPNFQYATFPSFSFAWRATEENFMKGIGFLDELKIKMSYGLTGNDKIPPFRYLNLYSSGYNYYENSGIIPSQIPNPDLKWETTENYNAGLDIAIFNERIMFAVDVYYNKTTDLLLNRPLPGSSGFTGVTSNVGALENKGLEFMVSTTNFSGEFNWSSNFNISFNENKVLELYNDQPITDVGRGNNAAIVGEALGVFYMYRSLGVNPSTGDLFFDDVNNDGQITEEDRTIVGNPNPDFTGGLTNNLSYKNFDMKIFLQFVYGNDIFNGTRQYAEAMKFGTSDNQLSTVKDRWRQPGDITYVPRHNGTNNLFPLSSHYLEDGSFLRVKDVSLGYNFDKKVLGNNSVLNNARLYVKVQNIYTLTPYSGMDPEVNYSGVGTISAGTDFFTYPQVRTYTLGLNLNF